MCMCMCMCMSRISGLGGKDLRLVLGTLVSPIRRDGLNQSNQHRNDGNQYLLCVGYLFRT